MPPLFNPTHVGNFHVYLFNAHPQDAPGGVGVGVVGSIVDVAIQTLLLRVSHVENLNAAIEVEEYHEGGNNTRTLKFKTWGADDTIKLKRGVTFSPDLWDWHYQVLYGNRPLRKNGLIILDWVTQTDPFGTDPSTSPTTTTPQPGGQAATNFNNAFTNAGLSAPDIPFFNGVPVAAWYFRNALPKTLSGPILDAIPPEANRIAFEEIELSHEGLFRLGLNFAPPVADALTQFGV